MSAGMSTYSVIQGRIKGGQGHAPPPLPPWEKGKNTQIVNKKTILTWIQQNKTQLKKKKYQLKVKKYKYSVDWTDYYKCTVPVVEFAILL